MSPTPTPTPLPELEHELLAAARRLDAVAAPTKRRWWLHGWSLLSIVVVAAGASVAVARVAEVGPFAYMSGGIKGENPKLAPVSTITLQPNGEQPRWQARAYLNGLDQLCITGGPRDPRTSPGTSPGGRRNNAPQNGLTCTDSLGVAEQLVDPTHPGASFAASSELDGSLQGHMCRMNEATGRCVPVETDPPTRLLVYGVRAADAPRPVVRWYSRTGPGAPIEMQASQQRLRVVVDKSPDGLSPDEFRRVQAYPDRLDVVLWAAEVPIPAGIKWPQVAFPNMFAPHGVDDATIEMIGSDDLTRIDREQRHAGWKYTPGISRDAPPVRKANAAQREWIAAFARRRVAADAVPERLHTQMAANQRFGYPASRKLSVVGGGLDDVWIGPGGMPVETGSSGRPDQICFVGATVLQQCKFGQRRWKRPFVEAVSCTQAAGWPKPLAGGRTLVWALAPPGATGVAVHGPGDRVESFPAAELLAVRRPVDERITSIVWTTDAGRRTRVRVPWPKDGPRCEPGARGGQVLRKDNAGSHEESSGRPPGTP